MSHMARTLTVVARKAKGQMMRQNLVRMTKQSLNQVRGLRTCCACWRRAGLCRTLRGWRKLKTHRCLAVLCWTVQFTL